MLREKRLDTQHTLTPGAGRRRQENASSARRGARGRLGLRVKESAGFRGEVEATQICSSVTVSTPSFLSRSILSEICHRGKDEVLEIPAS